MRTHTMLGAALAVAFLLTPSPMPSIETEFQGLWRAMGIDIYEIVDKVDTAHAGFALGHEQRVMGRRLETPRHATVHEQLAAMNLEVLVYGLETIWIMVAVASLTLTVNVLALPFRVLDYIGPNLVVWPMLAIRGGHPWVFAYWVVWVGVRVGIVWLVHTNRDEVRRAGVRLKSSAKRVYQSLLLLHYWAMGGNMVIFEHTVQPAVDEGGPVRAAGAAVDEGGPANPPETAAQRVRSRRPSRNRRASVR